jgi:hypothetical protein
MAKREGYEPTDEWLERINEELRKKDVPHKQRPWEAWMKWSRYAGVSTSLGGVLDEEVDELLQASEPVLTILERIQKRKERSATKKQLFSLSF